MPENRPAAAAAGDNRPKGDSAAASPERPTADLAPRLSTGLTSGTAPGCRAPLTCCRGPGRLGLRLGLGRCERRLPVPATPSEAPPRQALTCGHLPGPCFMALTTRLPEFLPLNQGCKSKSNSFPNAPADGQFGVHCSLSTHKLLTLADFPSSHHVT